LLAGAAQLTVALVVVVAATAVAAVGAPGTVVAVMVDEGAEALLVPMALVAVTVYV
jgi:hypothetical protein